MNDLADGSNMSIGRVYYWFPDRDSVIAALVTRAVDRLATVFADSVNGKEHITTPLLLQQAIAAMCEFIDENPAVVTLSTTGGTHCPGERLFQQLVQFGTTLVYDRVPGIPATEVAVVAHTATGIALGMLHGYTHAGPARPLIRQELTYVLSAYLYARFPPPPDPTWTLPTRAVQPSRPSRTNFTESTVVWPALADADPSATHR